MRKIQHSQEKVLGRVGASILYWRVGMAVGQNHDIAIAAGLVVLYRLGVLGVWRRPLDLVTNALEVCIDDKGGRELLVVVLEGELVLAPLWHLHPDSCLADGFTVYLVGLQRGLP